MLLIPNEVDAAFPAQAEPDSVDFDALVAGINATGVISGCAVTPQGAPNMTVAVAAGVVEIGGLAVAVAAGNVAVGAASVADRFDLVVVSNAGVKSVVAGTPAVVPAFPPIPALSVVLASVYVPVGTVAIGASRIVDKRVIVGVPVDSPVFANVVTGGGFRGTGLVGAANGIGIVGRTAGGPPTAGTWAVGDIVDSPQGLWHCTGAGTPGTWSAIGKHLIGNLTANGTSALDFASIPTWYRNLELSVRSRTGRAAVSDQLVVELNGDTTIGNYFRESMQGLTTTMTVGQNLGNTNIGLNVTGNTAPANSHAQYSLWFPDYLGARLKMWHAVGFSFEGVTTGTLRLMVIATGWNSVAAINEIKLYSANGASLIDSVAQLYGSS